MKKSTIYDVAKMAGVSPGTISRHLNGYELRDYNKIKVEQAIEELGFKENIIAKGLKSHRSMTVAVLIPELTGLFSLDILKAIDLVLEEKGYTLIISDYERDPERLKQRLKIFEQRSIDGLIIFPLSHGDSCLEEMQRYLRNETPIICLSDKIKDLPCDYIHGGNRMASYNAIEELINKGHRNIRIVTGRRGTMVTNERMEGCREAFRKYGIPESEYSILWTDYTMNNARDIVLEELKRNPPTAVYCTSYYLTMGCVLALNKSDLQLGEDVSLIGHDYYPGIEIITPALTTVEHDLEKMGSTAGKLLLKRIENGNPTEPEDIEIPMSLNIRKSVKDLKSI
ncbi:MULTISPECIES: LacI family DNA-binding transcriptional regulator [unclassified Oceanispirochaeta]|uniref:LacI family DNA-binding transcriptional regulator n=1 Tax=unclassified Oceanispirochaeta TaxID=2635722 RepID=UPI000E09D0BE|nr:MULTISPECIES: LacI family DNA-binding transcriptional regulator [unclassified Oceanispirochaeta]MBF9018182.1 LacI family DNA-binding transcriptional regulator [Oceanispirochaeta sp. M2]NPD74635.1 LacI family transcriptional regulator [Oceanispirochaeta sp. M1]RDG29505.1 LacI family transcriptional regulator [Oceanispirochaeta sp. M1]